MTDLTPWTTNDTHAQWAAGYADGERHCREGWCVDAVDHGGTTSWLEGYKAGWDAAKAAGQHGNFPRVRDRRLPVWKPEYR